MAYPDNREWFRQLVWKELDYQTKRLRRHPCMALWCGNNENQWIFEDAFPKGGPDMPSGGLIIYNQMVPAIVRANCPDIPYWRTGPFRDYGKAGGSVSIETIEKNGEDYLATLKSAGYTHAVALGLPAAVRLDDAYFDMLPGDVRTIRVTGAAGQYKPEELRVTFLTP